jgi:hypothetical protein
MLSQIKKKIEFSSLWVCKSTLKYIELILINSFNSTYSDCLMKMKNFSEHVLNCCRAFRPCLWSKSNTGLHVFNRSYIPRLKCSDTSFLFFVKLPKSFVWIKTQGVNISFDLLFLSLITLLQIIFMTLSKILSQYRINKLKYHLILDKTNLKLDRLVDHLC